MLNQQQTELNLSLSQVPALEVQIEQMKAQITGRDYSLLKAFFEDVSNKLLKVKKQQIESRMKHDLNINLTAYRDVIDRVELSENLANLTYKIFHTSGNEVYLNQLNTASKQIIVQVLLKLLIFLSFYLLNDSFYHFKVVIEKQTYRRG